MSYSGQDDNVGVVLTGLFTVSNNQNTAINSPRLKFNTETFGFEEELEAIVADIENEVYAFLFKGKKAQLELFGADGEPASGLVAEPERRKDCSRRSATRLTRTTRRTKRRICKQWSRYC